MPGPAPLPSLTARDVIGDLSLEAASRNADGDVLTSYGCAPGSWYAASMGAAPGLAEVGAPLHNHCTWKLEDDTLRRCRSIPKEGDAPPPGRARWEGALSVQEHPFFPVRSGNW